MLDWSAIVRHRKSFPDDDNAQSGLLVGNTWRVIHFADES